MGNARANFTQNQVNEEDGFDQVRRNFTLYT